MRFINGWVLLGVLVGLSSPVAAGAATGKAAPAKPAATAKVAKLTAAQIVQRHLAARGGLRAWQGVRSMVWNGKMELGYGDSAARSQRFVSDALARRGKGSRAAAAPEGKGEARKQQVQVPFLLEVKRPAKSRVEIVFAGKTAVQVYDGTSGWLKRPYLNRDDWEPFNPEQAKEQQGKWEMGGPLIDLAAKDAKVELAGVEQVDGHDAYKLKVTKKGGDVKHVWVDAKSFLDVKVEGIPRRMDGKMRTVWVTERDYRPVNGLMVPFMLETAVDGSPDTHKMIVEKVALNPQLDDALFEKPRA
ncbi:MAG TPA: hypothetical protein VMU15_19060 [Anaeromyxobacter sp.]|nr:hypothetical protein [Anaeromyxobacter sp.]